MIGQNSNLAEKNKEAKNIYAQQWLKELTEKGLEIKGDSIYISNEYNRALNDINYRKHLYPETYSWEGVASFIKQNKLKPAFWYLINLYSNSDEDKKMVMTFVMTYDKLFLMDEILVATFYTYSFMDPESSILNNGELETNRPDILEQKLRNVNEMVAFIVKNREQK